MYTSVREKLGLKTIKMVDGLVNKYNNGKRYLTFFFNFSFFMACIVTRTARTLAHMARTLACMTRMARNVTRMARWLAH